MSERSDLFDPDGLERLLAEAERDPAASRELDLVADLVAAAGLQRSRLTPGPRAVAPARSRRPALLALAAALVAVLGAVWWLAARGGSDGTPARFAVEPAPRYIATELRGGAEPLHAAFGDAMKPYATGRWETAVATLEVFLEEHPEHGPAQFYLAAALEQAGELERAERAYLRATGISDPALADHAHLRLALLLRVRGEPERARAALEELAASSSPFAANARALLDAER